MGFVTAGEIRTILLAQHSCAIKAGLRWLSPGLGSGHLDAYPRAYAYTLVATKEHREQVTADFAMEEYLELRQLVYWVSEAIREEVGAERMFIYRFGSNQGNSHAHWHVVPLPPGVPYQEHQGAWVSWSKGVLMIPEEEMASLAERIGRRIERIYPA